MRSIRRIQAARLQPPTHIFPSKAISDTAEPLHAQLTAQVLDNGGVDWIDVALARHLLLHPAGEVEVLGHGEGDLVAAEDVGDDGVVAVCCELVGDAGLVSMREYVMVVYAQLHVVKLEAKDVGHDQHSILGAAVFRVDLVRADWVALSVLDAVQLCGEHLYYRQKS